MKIVTFFVCNNGYGHFKRCAKIAYYLANHNDSVIINFICDESSISNNSDWYVTKDIINNPKINYIRGSDSIRILKNKTNNEVLINNLDWLDNSLLLKSDVVISDNISLILKIKPEAVLMGSFLWSQVLTNYCKDDKLVDNYCNEELKLLKQYKPMMIAHKDMAMTYVKEYTDFIPTSWVVDKNDVPSLKVKSKIKNILVIGGGTGNVDDSLVEIIENLNSIDKYNIYISKKIKQKVSAKFKMFVFGFSSEDFLNIDLMICRPGIGSITDAVTYSIPILGIGENGNDEIELNLQKIEELGFGLNITHRTNEVGNIINKIVLNGQYEKFQESLNMTEKDGIIETVSFLTKKFNL